MSTPQQIPTSAQLAAARLIHWHQSAPAAAREQASDEAESSAPELDAVEPEGSTGSGSTEQDGSEHAADAGDATLGDADHADAASADAENGSEEDGEGAAETPAAEAQTAPKVSAALLTAEAAREFLTRAGLLLFLPRPELPDAPSFVEATLGATNSAPTLAQAETARALAVRLIAEGSAVPLNLLGAPGTTGESPDFLVSAAVFPFIFTLRGDKAWKQLPSATGANKVSPLAVNTYALLVEQGPQSAYALTGELGKGLTEAAVLRALSELWQQLRVVPVPQTSGKPTLWEPITSRFQKQIKAGANAGQPSALSALISLYLGQALLATEDQIATFLSPVSPRSRVRDVLHGLMAGRQLEEVVIDGKQHLAIAGEMPDLTAGQPAPAPLPAAAPKLEGEDGSRIKRLVRKPAAFGGAGARDRSKPFRAPGGRGGDAGRGGDRPAARGPREGRAFNRPWDEEKQQRTGRPAFGSDRAPRSDAGPSSDRGPREDRPAPRRYERSAPGEAGRSGSGEFGGGADRPRRVGGKPPFGARAPFGGKPSFGSKPPFDRKGAAGERGRFGGDRPAFSRPRPGAGGPPNADARGRGDRPERPFRPDRPGRPDRGQGSDERPPRRDFAAGAGDDRAPRRPFRPRDNDARSDRPPFRPRADRGAEGGGERPAFRRFDAPRAGGGRSFGGPREGGDSRPPRRPFSAPRAGGGEPREGAGGSRPPRRNFGDGAARPPRPPFEGGAGARPGRPSFGARAGGARPVGGEGKRTFSKKPFQRAGSAGDKPAGGPFEKFKGGNKPWGKRPPARKIKPEGDEA